MSSRNDYTPTYSAYVEHLLNVGQLPYGHRMTDLMRVIARELDKGRTFAAISNSELAIRINCSPEWIKRLKRMLIQLGHIKIWKQKLSNGLHEIARIQIMRKSYAMLKACRDQAEIARDALRRVMAAKKDERARKLFVQMKMKLVRQTRDQFLMQGGSELECTHLEDINLYLSLTQTQTPGEHAFAGNVWTTAEAIAILTKHPEVMKGK